MSEWLLFGGCIFVLIVYVALLITSRTLFFGFNVLNVFAVASATLSAFVICVLFGLPLDWFTPEHGSVVRYSILGLLAMAAGIFIAWRNVARNPFRQRTFHAYVPYPPHFNGEVGWLTFWVGAAAEFVYPFVYSIPTVSTAVICVSGLARVGLCILLVDALHSRLWSRFNIALAAFAILSVSGSLVSGFTFIRINALVPLLTIFLVSFGINWRSITAFIILMVSSISAVSAWLETRILIRSGSLETLPLLSKASAFFSEYMDRLAWPNPESLFGTVMERVDMTEILAAQVAYQPSFEPYAYGETLISSFYTLVPRVLWSEKPEVAGGSTFVAQFTGLFRPTGDETSVGLPYPFELYANGGPIAVVVGLGIIGYICGRLELKMAEQPKSLGAFWGLALGTSFLCEGGQRSDVVLPALVASVVSAYGLGYVIQRFIRKGILTPAKRAPPEASDSIPVLPTVGTRRP
jgi:hypothetical protein